MTYASYVRSSRKAHLNVSCRIGPGNVQVITRFNLADFAEGVSDIEALRLLLDAGADIRGIRSLHANWNENSQDVSHNRRTGTAWKPSPKPVQVSPS